MIKFLGKLFDNNNVKPKIEKLKKLFEEHESFNSDMIDTLFTAQNYDKVIGDFSSAIPVLSHYSISNILQTEFDVDIVRGDGKKYTRVCFSRIYHGIAIYSEVFKIYEMAVLVKPSASCFSSLPLVYVINMRDYISFEDKI